MYINLLNISMYIYIFKKNCCITSLIHKPVVFDFLTFHVLLKTESTFYFK